MIRPISPSNRTRRWLFWAGLAFVLAACAAPASPTPALATSAAPATAQAALSPAAPTPDPSPLAPSPEALSPTATPTPFRPQPPTATPTASPSPTPVPLAERIPIIEYHHSNFAMGESVMMKPEWLEAQLGWLAENGFQTLSDADIVAFLNGAPYPQKSVALTFDIGVAKRSDYVETVIPLLRRFDQHAIFFLVSNTIVIGDDCNQGELFCWEELRQWADEGLISVGSHGIYHPDYKDIPAAEQKYDAGESKRLIEENMGRPVLGFAFPFDSSTEAAMRVVAGLGYQFATAGVSRAERSMLLADPNRFNLPRLYPYSNPEIYPLISGSGGKTFEQMITDSIAYVGWQTPTPAAGLAGSATPEKTSTPQGTSSPAAPAAAAPAATPVANPDDYLAVCTWIDRIADAAERTYALSLLDFASDLSPQAQARLPGVVIHPSCNTMAGNQPRAIVLHVTRGPLSGALNTFQTEGGVSAHYVIDRDGVVYQTVPETLVAFHVSCGGVRGNCVATCPICDGSDGRLLEPYLQSIGIELVNAGQVVPEQFSGSLYEDYLMSFGFRYWEDFPEAQLEALRVVVADIRARYNIPADMVFGHYRVNEKSDPGPALNLYWARPGNPPRPPVLPP